MAYKRVLLKLSGEALSGKDSVIDYEYIRSVGKVVKKCVAEGAEIAIVCGAGNIWRGRQGTDMDRVRADQMGMLATVINAIAIQDAFMAEGIDAVAMTAVEMDTFATHYTVRGVNKALSEGKVVILGGGTGHPFFSTDTGTVLRAAEIGAEVILMAKHIDGVYTADPRTNPDAVKLTDTTYDYVLANHLGVIDMTAASLAMDNNIPL